MEGKGKEEKNTKVRNSTWPETRKNALIKLYLHEDEGRSLLHWPPHGSYLWSEKMSINEEGRM